MMHELSWRSCRSLKSALPILITTLLTTSVAAFQPPSDRFDPLEAALDEAVATDRIPGGVAFVAQDEELLWMHAAGEIEPGEAMPENAIFPLASVGKMYTATAAMILREQGILNLTDAVALYLPAFSADPDLTIRHLLTHTSGLTLNGPEYWSVWNEHFGETTTGEFAAAIAGLPRVAAPGERFEYGATGGNYEILAAVIEAASGQTLEDLLFDRVFTPLGLHDTHFYLPETHRDRLPAYFRHEGGALIQVRERGDDWPRSEYFPGGGGISASAADVLRFSQIFLNDGRVDGQQILSAESVLLMMSDQMGDIPALDDQLDWGYGAAVSENATADRRELYGWVGGGQAQMFVHYPSRRVYFLAFSLDSPGDNDFLREFRSLAFETE
jgi:CubicO group peptidase (beta-lactamase class C family)